MEYKIEITMSPNFYDSAIAPYFYFWCVLGRREGETNWFNCGQGWASTPAKAWEKAYLYYDDITSI